MQKQIKVTVSAVGQPKIEAIGFNGQGCESATKGLESALGGGLVADREFKPEYANAEETQTEGLTY